MSRVPGTFKNRPPAPRRDNSSAGQVAVSWLLRAGALHAERWRVGSCTVMVAREPRPGGGYGWHISVSHPTRYPTWDEMKMAVYGIPSVKLEEGKTYAQLLGPVGEGEWVNVSDNCFHLYEIDDPLR